MNIKDLKELKGYVIITQYFEQYTWGITGCHRVNTIITNDGMPFRTKKEAIEYAKVNNIKNKSKKGEPNEGYGSVGAMSFTVTYKKSSELGKSELYYQVK